jgi:hypothetical protein
MSSRRKRRRARVRGANFFKGEFWYEPGYSTNENHQILNLFTGNKKNIF